MKVPDRAPYIFCDMEFIYLQFDTYIIKFDRTEGGLTKALKHVPKMQGTPSDYKRQLKPDWAVQARDKKGKFVQTKVVTKTAQARQVAKASPKLQARVNEAIKKMLEKKE